MHWTVVLLNSERLAAENLRRQAFDFYYPKIIEGGRPCAMFPGYMFVYITDRWRALRSTLGVRRLLILGDRPARISDAEIASIQQREKEGYIVLPSRLTIGQKVRVVDGLAAGMSGIYEGMSRRDRVRVMLRTALGMVRTELDARAVVAA